MTRKRKPKQAEKATSQRELSRRLNVSRSTVDRLREDGLSRDASGGYDMGQAEELLRQRSLRVAHMGVKELGIPITLDRPRTLLLDQQALRLCRYTFCIDLKPEALFQADLT
jgi:biotin operon repressor